MNSTIIEKLKNRYATKVFDKTKKISEIDFETILEAFKLTPSSFWLQPWKLIIVENQDIRENLVEHTWNQRQVADASHLLVLCTYTDFWDLHVEKYIDTIVKTRKIWEKKELEWYENMMKWFLKNLPLEMRKSWVENQIYIALWNLINTCAMLWIDDCPIWWFNHEKYDEILWIKEKWLASVVVLPIWYRDENLDKYAKLKKVRFNLDEIVEYIK